MDISIKQHDTKGKFTDVLKLDGDLVDLTGAAVNFLLRKTGLAIKQVAVIINTDPITSGSLVVGRQYEISTFVAGDDFRNVGAASNATGIVFTATGATPTDWTHGSSIKASNGQVEYQPTADDVATKGKFKQEWEVIFSDTKILTFPNDGYNNVTIWADLG